MNGLLLNTLTLRGRHQVYIPEHKAGDQVLMDGTNKLQQMAKFGYLRQSFVDEISADLFPVPPNENTSLIASFETSDEKGINWLLRCNKDRFYFFGDPLGLRQDANENVRLINAYLCCNGVTQKSLQMPWENVCGVCCKNIAHFVFTGLYVCFTSKRHWMLLKICR